MNAPAKAPATKRLNAIDLIMSTALDAVIVMNCSGEICGWSARAEEVFGFTATEVMGRSLALTIVPEAYRSAHAAGLARYLESGTGPVLGKRLELTALRKGGQEFPIELSITPWTSGPDLSFLGFVRDISHRREAENVIRREARQATLVGQLTAMAASEAALEDVLHECLAAVSELTGWPLGHVYLPSAAEPVELRPTGIWHPADHPHHAFKQMTEQSVFKSGVGLPGHVWKAKEPVWVRNMPDDAIKFPRAGAARDMNLPGAFGFPLFVHGRIAAIFEFFSDDTAPPDQGTHVLVRTLADQVGRVLERRALEEGMRAEIARRVRVEKHQELLLAEMNHRVKNMLAVVIGIGNQTGRSTNTFEAFKESFGSRLHALSRGYQLLTERNWKPALLLDIVNDVLAPHVGEKQRQLNASGPDVYVPAKQTLALSMIVHELTTNAVKYGALSVDGKIEVTWTRGSDGVRLHWQEHGLSGLDPVPTPGFGSKLVRASVRHELRGSVEVKFHPNGAEYVLYFPVDSEWRA